MVHRAIGHPLVDRWLFELRPPGGPRMIRKSAGAGGVLQALNERGLLVLPIDQNSTRGSVFRRFFGLPGSTNSGMARIAVRTDAPIVPAFIVARAERHHRVHVLPILQVERTGDPAEDVRRNTQRFTAVFEEMVRRHPSSGCGCTSAGTRRPPGEPRLY